MQSYDSVRLKKIICVDLLPDCTYLVGLVVQQMGILGDWSCEGMVGRLKHLWIILFG